MNPKQIKPKQIQRVTNSAPTYEEESEARRRVDSGAYAFGFGVGCFAIGIVVLMLGAAMWQGMRGDPTAAFLIFVAAIGLPLLITKLLRDSTRQRIVQELVNARLNKTQETEQQNENWATADAVKKLEVIYDGQPTNLNTLQSLLGNARSSVVQSEQLFKERAFTPFWDSIEEAADSLKRFRERVGHINTSAIEYYRLLEGREHSFPAFPVRSDDVPNPDEIVQKLTQVIGIAHRDFQFASIYEQRKTTSAIVAGFRNMQEAITRLREDIVSAISELHDSLDSGFRAIHSQLESMEESQQKSIAELRETLASHGKADEGRDKRDKEHQEFVKEALDNIQHRRKPRP